jgi:hypothetical protein
MDTSHPLEAPSAANDRQTALPLPFERLLRRSVRPLSAGQFIEVAESIVRWRRERGLTQRQTATHFEIPVRQVKTYEAAAKWHPSVKAFARQHAAHLSTRDLILRFAQRSWSHPDVLLNAMRRHVSGKPPRKRASQRASPAPVKDPDVLALEDRLRERLMTRVGVQPATTTAGEIRIAYFSLDDLERILALLGIRDDA